MNPKFISRAILLDKNVLLAVSVVIWWTANSITAVTSKALIRGEGKPDKNTWTDAFKDFCVLELTFLQHLIGAIVSIVWIKLVSRKSIWPTEGSKNIILISSVGNVVGNLSTNASYAIVSSSMTQAVKACEPLFVFALSLLLYPDYKVLNATTLLAIVIMVIGASLFVAYDSIFMVTGLLAAIFSNVAFPIRNIYLKKLNNIWEDAFQKYAVLSINSVFVLTPLILVKLVFFQSVSLMKYLHQGLFSSVCHCTYNLASIYVLQSFTPLSHAILNLSKRAIVVIANMAFFQLPISWKMILGLVAVLIGLYIYLYKNVRGNTFSPPSRYLHVVLLVLALGSIFFITIFTATSVGDSKDSCSINVSPTQLTVVVRTAWVYDHPFSRKILTNLNNLASCPYFSVIVYCGNSHCMDSITALHNPKIKAEFLLLRELFENTPLEDWLSKHFYYKVLAQSSYQDDLQEAAKLCLLLKYGGVYMDPHVLLQGDQTTPISECTKPWILGNNSFPHFPMACFPPQDTYLTKIVKNLADGYYKPEANDRAVVSFDDADFVNKSSGIVIFAYNYTLLSLKPDVNWNRHYGTLSFDARVDKLKGFGNLGDEIQSFPGLQFLPFLDNFLERDKLHDNKNNQSITAFLNGWWGDDEADWPPQPNIDPFLFAIHIAGLMKPKWIKHTSYLKERAPIGCRDSTTLGILSEAHVPAYFSACMTTMLQFKSKLRTDEIIIVDIKEEIYVLLPEEIRKEAIKVTHHSRDHGNGNLIRFTKAFRVIERYSRAKLVITQRIHAALPCVGMGTPVLFINSPKMPGGGGSNKKISPRIAGLTNLFHTLDMYKLTTEQGVRDWFAEFPWDNPPPNPDMAAMMKIRATFWYQIRERPSLYDSAKKFGLIPLHPPSACKDRLEFHILFLLPDSRFTWQDHRSIESILRYHPCAYVRIHSNTLDDTRFNVFRESGYQVTTVELEYTCSEIFRENKLELYKTTIQNAPNPLKNNLLRAAILYKWGGFFMDSNVIIKQSLANFPPNFLVWKDSSKTVIDTSFMRFAKENQNLEKIIQKYSREIDPNIDIYAQRVQQDNNFEILTRSQYFGQLTIEQCYKTDTSTKALRDQLSSSAVVALPTDYSITKTIGTKLLDSELICTQLLTDSCVLCSKLLHSV